MKCRPKHLKMARLPLGFTLAAALAGGFLLRLPAAPPANDDRSTHPAPRSPLKVTPEGLTVIPQGAYQEDSTPVIQASQLFRTGASRTSQTSSDIRSLRKLPEMDANAPHSWADLDVNLGHGEIPLLEMAFAPQDADLKVGPVYFDLLALSAATLYTDNANESENHPDAQTGLYLRMTGRVIAQLTEGLRLAATGSIYYLPLENKVGPEFALPYGVPLPSIHTELSWGTTVGSWNVLFFDVFGSGYTSSGAGSRGSLDSFNESLADENAKSELYNFRTSRRTDIFDGDYTETFYLSNRIGASGERLWPGSLRLSVKAFHENFWYNQGNRGLPKLRDIALARLQSEKENTRFKPFATYRASLIEGTDDNQYNTDGLNQEARVGVDGPLTENIQLHLDGGIHHLGKNGRNDPVYGFGLIHQAGPYTQQTLWVDRHAVGFLEDELEDQATYSLQQTLGPRLRASLFGSVFRYEDLVGQYGRGKGARAGVQLRFQLGGKSTFVLQGVQKFEKSDEEDLGDYDSTIGTFEWIYHLKTDLLTRLIYQYAQRDSTQKGDSYTENSIFFSVTRYFP